MTAWIASHRILASGVAAVLGWAFFHFYTPWPWSIIGGLMPLAWLLFVGWYAWANMQRLRWGSEPVDDAHALYRERYDKFAEALHTLPPGNDLDAQTQHTAFAQTVHMLHEYGDAPLKRQNLLGATAILGAAGGANTWLIGGAAVFAIAASGWGMNAITSARLEHAKEALAVANEAAQHNAAAAKVLNDRLTASAAIIAQAEAQAHTSARTIEAERARTIAAERRNRERDREMQRVLAGGAPPGWSDIGNSVQPSAATGSDGDHHGASATPEGHAG